LVYGGLGGGATTLGRFFPLRVGAYLTEKRYIKRFSSRHRIPVGAGSPAGILFSGILFFIEGLFSLPLYEKHPEFFHHCAH
jgi:hypothetical protein